MYVKPLIFFFGTCETIKFFFFWVHVKPFNMCESCVHRVCFTCIKRYIQKMICTQTPTTNDSNSWMFWILRASNDCKSIHGQFFGRVRSESFFGYTNWGIPFAHRIVWNPASGSHTNHRSCSVCLEFF